MNKLIRTLSVDSTQFRSMSASEMNDFNAAKNGDTNYLQDKLGPNPMSDLINKTITNDQYTLLVIATKENQIETIQFLCSFDNIDVNAVVGWNKTTALMRAAERGFEKAVKILVARGASCRQLNAVS
jgi:ankyrin repeat protein